MKFDDRNITKAGLFLSKWGALPPNVFYTPTWCLNSLHHHKPSSYWTSVPRVPARAGIRDHHPAENGKYVSEVNHLLWNEKAAPLKEAQRTVARPRLQVVGDPSCLLYGALLRSQKTPRLLEALEGI